MQAEVGDKLIVRGHRVGDPERRGVITEVQGANGAPPYQVQWSDGHESSLYPSSDAIIEHVPHQARPAD